MILYTPVGVDNMQMPEMLDSLTSSPEKINVFEIFKLLVPNTNVRVI